MRAAADARVNIASGSSAYRSVAEIQRGWFASRMVTASKPAAVPRRTETAEQRSVASVSAFRVITELSQSAALPKQIPTLVQGDLQRFQARVLFGSQLVLRPVAEPSLFVDELLDLLQDLCVVHH